MIAWVGYEATTSFERKMELHNVRERIRRTENEVCRLYGNYPPYLHLRRVIRQIELVRVS